MKVICIDNTDIINPVGTNLITIGKVYDLLEDSSPDLYRIVDDTGTKNTFRPHRFKPYNREKNLNMLIDESNL